MTISLSDHNAMQVGVRALSRPLPTLSVLEGLGYGLVPIETLCVLNADPRARYPDLPLRRLADDGAYDAIVSGPDTSLVFGKYPRPPHGPVVRNDVLDTEGNGRSHFRGCVVVLEDDSVVMGRADGASHADLKRRFSQPGNPLRHCLGGGAILIENGRKVSHQDLMDVQLIGSGLQGLNARCMAEDVHTFMGIRKGKAFAGWCMGRSGRRMQEDFFIHGFGTLIKFAYGSAAFFDDCIDRMNGINGTGFGIRRAY